MGDNFQINFSKKLLGDQETFLAEITGDGIDPGLVQGKSLKELFERLYKSIVGYNLISQYDLENLIFKCDLEK